MGHGTFRFLYHNNNLNLKNKKNLFLNFHLKILFLYARVHEQENGSKISDCNYYRFNRMPYTDQIMHIVANI